MKPSSAPPIRLTYLHQHYRAPHQAGGTRSWEFARRFARDGFVVTMIAGGYGVDGPTDDGFFVRYMGVKYDNRQGFVRRVASFAHFMAKSTITASRIPADVIFATSTPLTVAIPARVASRLRRAPYIFEVRDVWPKVPIALGYLTNPVLIWLGNRLEIWAYRGAARIVALSPGMRSDVLSKRSDITVDMLPNASDIELFLQSPEQAAMARSALGWTSPTVCYFGSLGESYDPEWLVYLARELSSLGVPMYIFGDGSSLARCRKLAADLDMDPLALLPGPLPKEKLPKYLAAASISVSSLVANRVLEDNSLNKVFDALAAGRPLVFNHGGWLADACAIAGAGWRVSRDAKVAAGQIVEKLREESAISRAGLAAQGLARESFAREEIYSRLRDVVIDIVATKP